MEFWVQIILSIALLQMCTLTKNSLRMKETLCALLTLVVFAFNCTFNCTFCTCPWEHWLFYHGPRRSTRRPSILHRPACHCLSLLVIACHSSYQLNMTHSNSPGRRLQIHETSLSFVKVVARCSWARRSGRPCSFRSPPIMDMMQYFASPHVIVLQFLAVDTVDFFYTMKGMSHTVVMIKRDQRDQKGPKGIKRKQKGSKLQFQCLWSFVCIHDKTFASVTSVS